MRIYVASSWRNYIQPAIVHLLRKCGHEVYDFKNPPDRAGFGWEQVNPNWKKTKSGLASDGLVSVDVWREMLRHPIAVKGYDADKDAIDWCDAIVYVLPCGKSASWELGYAMGKGKKAFVIAFGFVEPELMFREATILANMPEFFEVFGEPKDESLSVASVAAANDVVHGVEMHLKDEILSERKL